MAARAATEKFSKIVLASAGEFPYSTSSHGGVAQLGERLTGSQEVRGSIPLVSTRALNEAPTQVGAFFHIGTQGQRRHHDPPGRQDRALNGRRVHGSISRRGATLLCMEVIHCFCNHQSQGLLAQRLAQVLYTHKAGGSNPSSPTIELETVLASGPFLFGPSAWDSNPKGCGAEETRSVFQRSTQGAKRRSGTRPPKRRTRNPSVPYQQRAPRISTFQPNRHLGTLPKCRSQLLLQNEKLQKVDFQACPKNPPSKYRRPKPIRTKSALHLENISPVPKSEPSATTK